MKSLLSKDEKTKLLEALRRQGIIIRKTGIEIEMSSFDTSSLKGVHFVQEKLLPWNIEITPFQPRTGICVISNAFILKEKLPEVKITVDARCCACVTPESHKTALSAMKLCQINVIGEKKKPQKNNGGVYKLYTELEGFKPKIYRTFLIKKNMPYGFVTKYIPLHKKNLEAENYKVDFYQSFREKRNLKIASRGEEQSEVIYVGSIQLTKEKYSFEQSPLMTLRVKNNGEIEVDIYECIDDVFTDPDVDIIYISTPHNTHIRYLKKALANGKHVLCEKSITLNIN